MFGDILRELRTEKGLTQDELAIILKVTRRQISSYELEECEPNFDILRSIADYFNCSLDYLLGRTKEMYNLNLLNSKDKAVIIDLIKSLDKNKRR